MSNLSVENLGDKTRQSIKWSFIFQLIQKVFFFVSSIILARLLTPQDYGLATMAITLDMITCLILTLGINSAVIHFQDNIEKRLNAAFWLLLLSSGFFVALQMLVAPFVAQFYNAPVLVDIIRVSAISLLIRSLGSIQKTILIKSIDFKKISILEGCLSLMKSCLYVILAFAGFGVWSFIYPKVVSAVINVISLWKMSSWRPELKFHFEYWGEMFKYGKNVLFSNLIDYLINNSSFILIGRMIGPVSLGIFSFAYEKSMTVVNNIAYPISTISFPAFSKLQDHNQKLKNAFFKTVKSISIMTFPLAMGQIVLGPEYINVVFGEKWSSAIIIFQILIVYSLVRSICQCGTPILQSVGKPQIVLRWNLLYAPVFIFSLFVGSKFGDAYGVGVAMLVVGALGSLIYLGIVIKVLKWHLKDLYEVTNPALYCSLIMFVVLFSFKLLLKSFNLNNVAILCLLIPVGVIVYTLSMKILFTKTYEFIIENLMKFLNKRKGVKDVLSEQKFEQKS